MKRNLASVCVIVVLLCATPALADWDYTKWGMTPAQVMAGSSGMVKAIPKDEIKRDDPDHWEISLRGDIKAKGRTRPASFMFDTTTGGLRCVIYNALGSDAGTLKQDLVGKYGPGKEDTFGDQQSIDWVTPDEIGLVYNETRKSATVMHCRPGG
jgi:hypothetical protein